MKNTPVYDLVIVGAGIAGLAIAELFTRAGRKVVLLERNKFVCSESSGAHHEWFHFGSLYAIFPTNDFMRTLVGGIDDLLAHYSGFPGMNLQVSADGQLRVTDSPGKWIRDDPIDYIVTARNDPDFSLWRYDGCVDYVKKVFAFLTWEMAIKQFISRHKRFYMFDWRSGQASEWVPRRGWWNYSRDVIFRITQLDAALDKNTHFRVPGFDRPMDSNAIISDLLRSFLHHDGELRTKTSVTNIETESESLAHVRMECGDVVSGRYVVVASGPTIDRFFDKTSLELTVILSPLLVVYPAVSFQNFVRLTPFPEKSVCHLCHMADGTHYSVIGGGYQANPEDELGIEKARAELTAMAREVFPQIDRAEVAQIYESYKVELKGRGNERNYQYQAKEVAKNVYIAIPGKFSLGFSLAVDIFRKITGEEPPKSQPAPNLDVSRFTTPIRHKQIVLDHLAIR